MDTNEMIEILQAYKEGEIIEYKYRDTNSEWKTVDQPRWNFGIYNYRVKPLTPDALPYDSVTEIDRDTWLENKVNHISYRIEAVNYEDNTLRINGDWYSLEELLEKYEYENKTPCGKWAADAPW